MHAAITTLNRDKCPPSPPPPPVAPMWLLGSPRLSHPQPVSTAPLAELPTRSHCRHGAHPCARCAALTYAQFLVIGIAATPDCALIVQPQKARQVRLH